MPSLVRHIGIYAGTFDPIHIGHINFATTALQQADLDQILFMPEHHPRFKPQASLYDDRLANIQRILASYEKLTVLTLPDTQFTIHQTLPALQSRFPQTKLFLLIGSDVVKYLPMWPDVHRLVSACDFIVGLRHNDSETIVRTTLSALGIDSDHLTIVKTAHSHLSSTQIRNNHRP